MRVFGPLFEWRSGPGDSLLTAVHPLYSHVVSPQEKKWHDDYLWPVGAARGTDRESAWRVLTALGTDFAPAQSDGRYRTWVLPFLFWGRDVQTNGYFAFFPFGGSIHEFLGRDEIDFALFPLWSNSTMNDMDTLTVLWPVFSKTDGPTDKRFRLFPFYGYSWRDQQWTKRFILWPFWTDVEYYVPGAKGGGFVFFPFYGHIKMENQETWMFIPPFIRHSVSPRLTKTVCPWPFIQLASGDIDKVYIWPLWGYDTAKWESNVFVLWPIINWREQRRPHSTRDSFSILPVFYTESGRVRTETNAPLRLTQRRVTVWPLVTYARHEQDKRVRVLDVWPFPTPQIERNWAPLWTLYTHQLYQGACDDDLLWGFFRYARKENSYKHFVLFPFISWTRSEENGTFREWSILKGLIGRRIVNGQSSYKFLFTFYTKEKSVAAGETP